MGAIVVEGLRKHYDDLLAVRDVSFEVAQGEVFALLGPNGAGKTTTIEILEGLRARDGGTVRILGLDPSDRSTSRALRERLGIVLQECAVEPFLTVREVLLRHAAFYPTSIPVDDVIDAVGLTTKAGARVKTLSGGQQRRLDVGLGIIGRPEVIFLDEPTTGFDPAARREAWDLVRGLREHGAAVLLTTHYMDEAEALADRLAIIAGGEIVAEGTPSSLGQRDAGSVRVRFALPTGVSITDLPVAAATVGSAVEIDTTDEVAVLHQLTSWALSGGHDLPGLTVERASLEDVYLRLTQRTATIP